MKIKEILTESIKKAVDKMDSAATASVFFYGVEEMPESMKEKR